MKVPEDINEAANALAESLDAAVFVYSGAIDEMGFGLMKWDSVAC